MKFAIIALLQSTSALRFYGPNLNQPLARPLRYHWNEDPHSVPNPLEGKKYLTSTQARFVSEEYTGHIKAEDPGHPPNWYTYSLKPYGPYNQNDPEMGPLNRINHAYIGTNGESESDSESSSDSESAPQ